MQFSLVTVDLDYTAFLANSVLYLNKVMGISDKLEQFHRDYGAGIISEKELNLMQAPLLEGISLSKAFEELSKGPVLKRLERGTKLLRNQGIDVQMLSLNPLQAFFTRYGIKTDVSMLCEIVGDHLGEIKNVPENKVFLLKEYCRKNNVDLARCSHVGDGRNDIETFRAVGFSVALNPSDSVVRKEASVSLRTYDFTDVANTIIHAHDLA